MTEQRLTILNCGSCETLKASIHATALGLTAVMSLYNVAAWLRRRETHLGVNSVIYGLATIWEVEHIVHHLRERGRPVDPALDALRQGSGEADALEDVA